MHGDVPGNPLQLHRARLDLEVGDELRGTRKRQDVIGDDDLIGSNEDLKALIGAASEFGGPGFLLPLRNAELLRWCLEHGLKVTQVMTLMTLGLYNEPRGAYLPSILF